LKIFNTGAARCGAEENVVIFLVAEGAEGAEGADDRIERIASLKLDLLPQLHMKPYRNKVKKIPSSNVKY